ncbi:hypothetical protein BDZ91DRAFT_102795 [Kalaharituber pfeilii]|nr:hypothetical protein BDZ91DRAFT_102795 [Kalaharituber pfeilii]
MGTTLSRPRRTFSVTRPPRPDAPGPRTITTQISATPTAQAPDATYNRKSLGSRLRDQLCRTFIRKDRQRPGPPVRHDAELSTRMSGALPEQNPRAHARVKGANRPHTKTSVTSTAQEAKSSQSSVPPSVTSSNRGTRRIIRIPTRSSSLGRIKIDPAAKVSDKPLPRIPSLEPVPVPLKTQILHQRIRARKTRGTFTCAPAHRVAVSPIPKPYVPLELYCRKTVRGSGLESETSTKSASWIEGELEEVDDENGTGGDIENAMMVQTSMEGTATGDTVRCQAREEGNGIAGGHRLQGSISFPQQRPGILAYSSFQGIPDPESEGCALSLGRTRSGRGLRRKRTRSSSRRSPRENTGGDGCEEGDQRGVRGVERMPKIRPAKKGNCPGEVACALVWLDSTEGPDKGLNDGKGKGKGNGKQKKEEDQVEDEGEVDMEMEPWEMEVVSAMRLKGKGRRVV